MSIFSTITNVIRKFQFVSLVSLVSLVLLEEAPVNDEARLLECEAVIVSSLSFFMLSGFGGSEIRIIDLLHRNPKLPHRPKIFHHDLSLVQLIPGPDGFNPSPGLMTHQSRTSNLPG